MWTKTFKVSALGGSKVVFVPNRWKIKDGDWLQIKTTVNGQVNHETCRVGNAASNYIVIPSFWPFERGDFIDLEMAFADVPESELRD